MTVLEHPASFAKVEIGGDKYSYRELLFQNTDAGIGITSPAWTVLEKLLDEHSLIPRGESEEVELLDVDHKFLGTWEYAKYASIRSLAVEKGLRFTPIETVLRFWLQNPNALENGEYRIFGMDGVKTSNTYPDWKPKQLGVARDGDKRFIMSYSASTLGGDRSDRRWLFRTSI